MTLTNNFKNTVLDRARRDSGFRVGLLIESVQCFLNGDVSIGKGLLRKYINSDIGYKKLSDLTGIHEKSLIRMFGPRGNPQAYNLFEVISKLQQYEKISLEVTLIQQGGMNV